MDEIDNNMINYAMDGNVTQLEQLLHQGADIEARDFYDWTPLLYAVHHGKIDAVIYLLNCGANIHATNNIGDTVFTVCRDMNIRNILNSHLQQKELDGMVSGNPEDTIIVL